MAKTTENIARAAQRRASITAYLNQHPQAWVTAADLGTALELTAKEASYTGQDLAEQGLCRRAINADGRGIYASLNASPESLPEGATAAKTGGKAAKQPRKARLQKVLTPDFTGGRGQSPKMHVGNDEDVELMVGGKLIVIGRNSSNGRIRITLE